MVLIKQLANNTKAVRNFRPMRDNYQKVRGDSAVLFLEKADPKEGGQVTLNDISKKTN